MDTEQYAGIILGLLTEQLDKRFQYRIPDHLKSKVHVGSVVYVPFGAGNKKTKGFVIDISSDLSFDRDKIKDISDVLHNAFLFNYSSSSSSLSCSSSTANSSLLINFKKNFLSCGNATTTTGSMGAITLSSSVNLAFSSVPSPLIFLP